MRPSLRKGGGRGRALRVSAHQPSGEDGGPRGARGASWTNGRWACLPASTPAWACKLDVAHELGVPTVHLHAPHEASRTHGARRASSSHRLDELGIRITRGLRRLRGRKLRRHPHRRAHRGPGAAGHAGRAAQGNEGDCRFRPAAGRRRGGAAPGLRAARRRPTRSTARCWP